MLPGNVLGFPSSETAAAAAVAGHDASGAAHADIRALISGLEGNGAAASTFGFLPSATADANVAALQAAVDASATVGTIYVTQPGIYDMNAGVSIPSNCSLVFCAGVTLRKTAAFSRVFYPVGVPTRTTTSNVRLVGDSTTILQNGQGSGGLTGHAEALTMIDVYFTDNWLVSGFIFDVSTGMNTFTIHGGECTRLRVENCRAFGASDNVLGRCTLQLQSGARNCRIRNYETTSQDDDIALNSADYPGNVLSLGDIEDITVDGLRSHYWGTGQVGYVCRLTQGAWLAWASGSAYKVGDCANNDGKQYKVSGSTGASFPITATAAPTHTSGTVAGADGIQWAYMGIGTFTSSSVRNVTISGIETERQYGPSTTQDDDEYNRAFYPGTEGNGRIDGIRIDGVNWKPTVTSGNGGFTNFSGCNVGAFTVSRLSTATSGDRSIVYSTAGNVESYVLSESVVDHNSAKAFYLLGGAIKKLQIDRSSVLGHLDNAGGNDSFIKPESNGGVKKVVFTNSHFENNPNLLSSASNVSGLSLAIDNCTFAGNAKIIAVYGNNTPIAVYRRNCTLDVDDGSLFYSLYGADTSPLDFVTDEPPVLFQAVGSGTAYQFTDYVTAIAFGTSSPSVSVTKTGRYRVRARLLVKFNGATFAAAQTLRIRLRVGVSYTAQTIITLPVMATETDTRIVEMPEYLYRNLGTETVTLHADMSEAPSAGTVTCEECELTLIPISQA